MKIANKIGLSFFVAVTILTIVAGTVFYLTAKDSLQKSIYNNLTAVLASRTDHIETYLEMLKTSVGQLSRSITLMDFLKISDKEGAGRNEAFRAAMIRLARTKEANPAIAEFLLMDERGLVVASSNERNIGQDKSADAYFLGGQKEIYIKDVYFSEDYKEPLMAVSAPILDSQTGVFIGVLTARVRLNDLNSIVANRTGMGKTGEIYIVNKNGYMITPSIFTKDAVLNQGVDTKNVRHARLHKERAHVLSEDESVGVYLDYRGVPDLGAHEYIPQMQWSVIAEIDEKEAFQPLNKIRLLFFIILLAAPIAGWLLGIFAAGLIIATFNKLRKGIEIVGSGNLDYKVDTGSKDEVGQLSRAFDAMAQNLKLTTTSVERLDKEVAERKRSEDALRYFQKAVSSSADAIGMSTPDGRHYYQNEAFTKLFGFSINEVNDALRSLTTIYADKKVGKDIFDTIMRGNAWVGQVEMLTKDKRKVDISLRAYAIKDEEGKVLGLVGVHTDIAERKRSEEALLAAKGYTENIIKSMLDALIVINPDGKIRSINQAAADILGYKEEELINKSFGTIIAEEEEEEEEGIPFVGTRLKKLIKAGSISNYEVNFKNKDGNKIPVLLSGAVMRRIDCPGEGPIAGCPEFKKKGKHCEKLQGVVVVAKDITERKKAEQRLKESEERFRAIFNTTFQFTGLMTLDGTLIEANRAAVDFTGLKLEDVANRPFWETHWWKGNEERVQKLKESIRLAASGKFIRYETELQGAGDVTAFFDFSIKPVFNPNDKVVFLVPEGRDITARKKTDEEREKMLKVEQNVALLRQWLLMPTTLNRKLKTMTDSIVRIFDADFCRIWLIRPGDLCERGCIHAEVKEGPHVCRYRDKCLHLMVSSGRYTHTDGKGHARVPFDCYKIGRIASGEDHKFLSNDVVSDPKVHNHEWARELGLVSFAGYQIRVPDGETIGVLALFAKHPISPMEDAALDNLSSSVAFIVDQASVKKDLEESQHLLIQSSKMAAMGQLAAGISHELNQPLTGIKGFTQAVLMDLKEESPIRNDLNKIVEQADRMDAIIKNVRFFSRKSDFNMVEIDINQAILNSLMLLSQQLKTHNVRVIQDLDLHIPKIQGDANQLQQAFLNIISNARDAIISLNRPDGGEIRIHTSLSQDKDNVEIIFRDTGCGVSGANLQHIFSPFYTTKSPDRGMGLGLSITYRIIENHKGKVKFESEEGKGTAFEIALPIKRTEDDTRRS